MACDSVAKTRFIKLSDMNFSVSLLRRVYRSLTALNVLLRQQALNQRLAAGVIDRFYPNIAAKKSA
jgi:hypothetical protein